MVGAGSDEAGGLRAAVAALSAPFADAVTPALPSARRANTTDLIEARLREFAVSSPGVMLPSQRDLCAYLGVGRTALREAIQRLLATGELVHRHNGAVLATAPAPPGEAGSPGTRTGQLLEARRVFDRSVVALAASRATDRERDRLAALAERHPDDRGISADEWVEIDRSFHALIASMTHNDVLHETYSGVLDAFVSNKCSADTSDPDTVVRLIRDHQRIAFLVATRSGSDAAVAADNHLEHVARSRTRRAVDGLDELLPEEQG